jgi:hypothetical protein
VNKEENPLLLEQSVNSLLCFLTKFSGEGKWLRNIDYYRLDGSTTAQSRKKWAEEFNDETNVRYEPFCACTERSSKYTFDFMYSKIQSSVYASTICDTWKM